MTATLGLGTVQFGLPYGVANGGTEVEAATIEDVLVTARAVGVTVIDTAAQYGASEARLGAADLSGFTVVTKTPRLAELNPDQAESAVLAGAHQSLAKLGIRRLDALLVHNAADLLGPAGDAIHAALIKLRATGVARRIGVSVYDGDEIDCLLSRYSVDIVQLPVNVFDQRLVRGGQIAALQAAGIAVHARSAYLQGLLLMTPDTLPAPLGRFGVSLARFRDAARTQGVTAQQAALGWVRDLAGIEVVLVGAIDSCQLAETERAFREAPTFDASTLVQIDPDLLDPRRWSSLPGSADRTAPDACP